MWGRKVTCGAGMSRVGQEGHMWGRKVTCGAGRSHVGQECDMWGRKVTCGAGRSHVGQEGHMWGRIVPMWGEGGRGDTRAPRTLGTFGDIGAPRPRPFPPHNHAHRVATPTSQQRALWPRPLGETTPLARAYIRNQTHSRSHAHLLATPPPYLHQPRSYARPQTTPPSVSHASTPATPTPQTAPLARTYTHNSPLP